MTEPNAELLADESVPRVTLAGKQWPLPKLSIKQNAIVLPILMARFERVNETIRTQDGISELATALFTALQRGHKSLTRDEFDEMAIDVPELMAAVPVVAQQTGMYSKGPATRNGVDRPLAPATSPTGAG
jgi:hypothetical protein